MIIWVLLKNTMFIANSIERAASGLEEINTTFGHDIVYDWVNYSTSIGADYVSAHFFSSKAPRIFNEGISNNQVSYKTSLYQPGRNEFIRVAP